MKSKFMALELVGSKVEWLRNLLAKILLGMKPTLSVSIHYDCQATISITKNKMFNGKNKHICLRHNVIK